MQLDRNPLGFGKSRTGLGDGHAVSLPATGGTVNPSHGQPAAATGIDACPGRGCHDICRIRWHPVVTSRVRAGRLSPTQKITNSGFLPVLRRVASATIALAGLWIRRSRATKRASPLSDSSQRSRATARKQSRPCCQSRLRVGFGEHYSRHLPAATSWPHVRFPSGAVPAG